jgi:hypothetical protein
LGSFHGKPGHYDLDIEVTSGTQYLDSCDPRLQIEASYLDFAKWENIEDHSFSFCIFCESLGVAMLFVFATTHYSRGSLEELCLRIFATDPPPGLVPPVHLKPGRSFPTLLALGIFGVAAGTVVFMATDHWVDDLSAGLQIVSLLLFGTGLAFLFGYRFAWLRHRAHPVPLASSLPEQSATGITGLHYRHFPVRRAWAMNPVTSPFTITLAYSLACFACFVSILIVYGTGPKQNSQGLLVSLTRKGVSVASGLTAPIVTLQPKGGSVLELQTNYMAEFAGSLGSGTPRPARTSSLFRCRL